LSGIVREEVIMDQKFEESVKRTHNCGQLRLSDEGSTVRLCGWVKSYRDFGGVIFIVLRDRMGITQITFHPDKLDEETYSLAGTLRQEWVVSVSGTVASRGKDSNPDMDTGEIEVVADSVTLLNRSAVLPFEPDEHHSTSEENRLKYRYIDLRRVEMARSLELRHNICLSMREALNENGFLEIETPFLTKSTPEGARDFIVPSRMQPGNFYALPQSPQLFKQILMVGGMDRYYQIVRCFRDEDLRADRQPEFTQLDIEMSFCSEQDVIDVVNDVLRRVTAIAGKPFPDQVPVMDYAEAMRRFGSDRPDLRFGMELVDVCDLAAKTDFGVFTGAIESGGTVQCIRVPGGAALTRKQTDGLTEWVKDFGAKGVAVTKVSGGGR